MLHFPLIIFILSFIYVKAVSCGHTSSLLKLYSFGKEIICGHCVRAFFLCWNLLLRTAMCPFGVFKDSSSLGKDKNRISLSLITASPQRHTRIQIKALIILL